jgi:hypothetical protein
VSRWRNDPKTFAERMAAYDATYKRRQRVAHILEAIMIVCLIVVVGGIVAIILIGDQA